MIKRLEKDHDILCTSRKYNEVSSLTKIRHLKVVEVGKHGGKERQDKLIASINRTRKLVGIITKFRPDLTISFTSPEASRISFGLGTRHIAFSDSPHAESVMRLTLPLIQKLLTPWIIPKKEFARYGISTKDIVHYKAIDASIISRREVSETSLPFDSSKKIILIRTEEEQAAYSGRTKTIPIIKALKKEFDSANLIVISRYRSQSKRIRKEIGDDIKVIDMRYDGKILLQHSDVFVGSGGTMTAESALLGIPTISYNAVPNIIEEYLVRKGLVRRANTVKEMISAIDDLLNNPNKIKTKAEKLQKSMDDPYDTLVKIINS